MPNQAEINAILEKAKINLGKVKGGRSTSPKSDTLQVLVDQIAESVESIRPELEEWANAVSEITKQAEVLGEIGSLIQRHISSLLRAANYHGMPKLKTPQQHQPAFAEDFAEADFSPPPVAPVAEVSGGLTVPAPSGPGQGLTYQEWTGQDLANQVMPSGHLQGAALNNFTFAWGNNNHD